MIKLSNVSKSHKNHPKISVTQQFTLKQIDFVCEKGEVVCIVGANGSGKSTLLRILANILLPDGGTIQKVGKIGFVPQENGLFEDLSVKTNLDFWANCFGVKPNYSLLCGIELKKRVKYLSSGMKKKVSIVIALLNHPDCLIMDEPTASLDIASQQFVMDTIEEQKRKGLSVVFTTHNTDEMKISDKLYILNKGEFVYHGATKLFASDELFKSKLQDYCK